MDSNSTFTMADSPIRHKRARVSRACDQCRRKKIRCDADKSTPCTNCRTYGFGCSFLDSAKKRGPPKGYIEALENRLKRMEGLLGGLVDGVDKGSRPKKSSNREVEEERKRRKRDDDEDDDDEDGEEDDEEEDDEEDADEDGEEDGEEDNDSVSSSHSSHGRVHGYRRQRRRNEVSSMNRVSPLTGVDFNKNQHLGALSSPPQTPEEVVEDINENLEKLNIDESKEIRYVGNSSGLHMFTPQFELEDGIFKVPQAKRPPFTDLTQCVQIKEEPGCGEGGVADFGDAASPLNFDFEVTSELSNRLIGIYFVNIHGYFPIINKLRFLKQYYRELSTPPSQALIYSMLAIATKYLPKDELNIKPEALGLIFFERAKEALDQICVFPQISTVQALVLISLYQNGLPDATRHWLDCSPAIRMAQELGLHRSNYKGRIPNSEVEARKRLWWACYVMDRWFGATFGRPLVISDDDCDVEYPSIFEEDDEDMSTPISHSHGSFSPEPSLRSSSPTKKTSLAYKAFLEIIKISEILGNVLQTLYTPKSRKRRTGHDKIIKNLDDKLVAWKASLPQELQWQKDDSLNVEASPVIGSINLCYFTIIILLHRPYIPSTKFINLRSQFPSLRICTNAAVSITKISQCMSASKYFELTWPFSVYNIFQSSLIHMHNTKNSSQEVLRTATLNLTSNIQTLESLRNSFFSAHKLSLMLGALNSNNFSVNVEEPPNGGFWVAVENSDNPAPSSALASKHNPKSPSVRSSYPGFPTANARITSPVIDHRQRNRFSTGNANTAMVTTNDIVPTQLPVPPHVLSHTSLPMSSPSSNLVTMQPEPAFSLRQFAFTSQPEYQRPVSIPSSQPSPDENIAFSLDPNGGSGEMPNEYFRVDQSNPFYAMPSTYNVEDWDVWMVEHGSGGTMNVG